MNHKLKTKHSQLKIKLQSLIKINHQMTNNKLKITIHNYYKMMSKLLMLNMLKKKLNVHHILKQIQADF